MKTFLRLLILVPLVLIAVAFAVANRQPVTVSFDPFATDLPAFALAGPLFLVLIIVVVAGVVIGGVATWVGQGRHRRALRAMKRENEGLRADVERLRTDLATASAPRPGQSDLPALPALPGRFAA